MKRYIFPLCILVIFLFANISRAQVKDKGLTELSYGDNKWIQVHLLLQAQAQSQKSWQADESDRDGIWTQSMFLRRARLIFNGQVHEKVSFFVQTDDVNTGKKDNRGIDSNGPSNDDSDGNNTFVLDAFINYKIAEQLEFTFGLMPLPFMHQTLQSAASLLGVDYNSDMVILSNSTLWRDSGLVMRGLLAWGHIDYRIGAFQGMSVEDTDPAVDNDKRDNRNSKDKLRYAGRFQINFLEPEDGFFYSENYLGKKKIFSLGGGIDFQPDIAKNAEGMYKKDYFAWTIDLILDVPVSNDIAITTQAALLVGKNNPIFENGVEYCDYYSYYGQAGLLLFDVQLVAKYMYLSKTRAGTDPAYTKNYLIGGLNYFINGHNASLKFEYKHPLGSDHKDNSAEKSFTLQAQVYL